MKRVPDAIFVVDTNRELISIREAQRLNVPIVGLIDTNCDPDDVNFGIPANDDAIRSVKLFCNFIAQAVIAGIGAPVSAAEFLAEEAPERAADKADTEAAFAAPAAEAASAAAPTNAVPAASAEAPAAEATAPANTEAPKAE